MDGFYYCYSCLSCSLILQKVIKKATTNERLYVGFLPGDPLEGAGKHYKTSILPSFKRIRPPRTVRYFSAFATWPHGHRPRPSEETGRHRFLVGAASASDLAGATVPEPLEGRSVTKASSASNILGCPKLIPGPSVFGVSNFWTTPHGSGRGRKRLPDRVCPKTEGSGSLWTFWGFCTVRGGRSLKHG